MTIGDKIRLHRKALGMNQTELGLRLGVQTNAVSKWECGRVEDIPMSKVRSMALLFGVKISYLIDDEIELCVNNTSQSLSPDESDLLHKYRRLDDAAKGRIRHMVDYEYNSIPGSTANPAPKEA